MRPKPSKRIFLGTALAGLLLAAQSTSIVPTIAGITVAVLGVGYDNIDVGAAAEAGIAVANNPDYCADGPLTGLGDRGRLAGAVGGDGAGLVDDLVELQVRLPDRRADGVEHGASGNRLCPGLRAGQSSAGCGGGRGARGELGQTEPDEAERGTDFARDASCEVVGRAARRAHDDDLGSGKMTAKKIARDLEAGGSRSGSNDLHVTLLPDAMPETRKTAAPRCRDSDYTTRT